MDGQHIFCEAWWLDAVAGPDNWGECRVEQGGQLVARMPYLIRRRYGFTLITQPPLTQTLGPWFAPPPAKTKNAQRLAREKELTGALLEQLPPHDYFRQNFSPDITNWLPWYWKGYSQTTRYTYRLGGLKDIERLWRALRDNIRWEIRKAEKRGIEVVTDRPVDEFLPLQESTFARQGKPFPYSRDLVRRLDDACAARGARKIFIARDGLNRAHAGVYLVWNQHAAYYLMGGGDPSLRNSGATSLALWEAIKFASTVTEIFDFEGSMIEPVERFFRGFGARQVPYFSVTRIPNRWLACAHYGRQMLQTLRRPAT